MTKTNDIIFKDVDVEQATEQLMKHRNQILNDFAKAYLAETETKPSEVELVSKQETKDNIIETIYFFRIKS